VKAAFVVALPLGVVTVIDFAPTVPVGVVTVIVVAFTTLSFFIALPAIVTFVAPVKFDADCEYDPELATIDPPDDADHARVSDWVTPLPGACVHDTDADRSPAVTDTLIGAPGMTFG